MAEERNERAVTTVLRHPETNVPVEIIGTAHVARSRRGRRASSSYAPSRTSSCSSWTRRGWRACCETRSCARRARHARGDQRGDAPRRAARAGPGAGDPGHRGTGVRAVGAVLGSQPGAEFLAAIDAAKETGAAVALGDLDAKTTTARLFARTKWRAALRKAAERERHHETNTHDGDARAICHKRICPNPSASGARRPVTFPDASERPAPAPTPEAAPGTIDARRRMRRAPRGSGARGIS